MKEATDRVIGVIDADGNVVSCSETSMIGEKWPEGGDPSQQRAGLHGHRDKRTMKPLVSWSAYFDYAVFVDGDDDVARSVCIMAYVALNGAKTYYEEKHDKGTFVKNIITDNILPGDIYIRAKELHFTTDLPRSVLLIRQVGRADRGRRGRGAGMFPDKQQDFVLNINETDIAVVKQVTANTDTAELYKMAQEIEKTLKSELFIKTVIGISTMAGHLRELADAYKEAQTAIEVGKVFDTEKSIITYENLGIGRLIYQLPTTLCEIFLSEVFKKNSIDSLDQRRCSPSTSSLRTTSTCPRPPGSSLSTATPWSTAWRRSRSSRAWISGSLTTPSSSRWL